MSIIMFFRQRKNIYYFNCLSQIYVMKLENITNGLISVANWSFLWMKDTIIINKKKKDRHNFNLRRSFSIHS